MYIFTLTNSSALTWSKQVSKSPQPPTVAMGFTVYGYLVSVGSRKASTPQAQ